MFTHHVRRWLVVQFTDSCGSNIKVKHNADISPHISIGNGSELGRHSSIYGQTTIGKNVLMGPNVKIITRNHVFSGEGPINLQGEETSPVVIGDDVWIGTNVIVLPGVTIGSHSVIAAGAVVTKSCDPWSIIGGVPARVLGSRRDEIAE